MYGKDYEKGIAKLFQERFKQEQINLQKIKYQLDIEKIFSQVSNMAEVSCLKKCDFSIFDDESSSKDQYQEFAEKQNCYEVCLTKFFHSAMYSLSKIRN